MYDELEKMPKDENADKAEALPADPECQKTGRKKNSSLREQAVLNTIIEYLNEHQYPPSIRNICDNAGLKSTSCAHYYVKKLMRDGYLETDSKNSESRALRVRGYKFVKADSEEQGLLLRLPCKKGELVYKLFRQRDNFDDISHTIVTTVPFGYSMIDEIGKTIFLTRAEAEEALEKLENK